MASPQDCCACLLKQESTRKIYFFLYVLLTSNSSLRWAEQPISTARETEADLKMYITSTLKANRKAKQFVFQGHSVFLFIFFSLFLKLPELVCFERDLICIYTRSLEEGGKRRGSPCSNEVVMNLFPLQRNRLLRVTQSLFSTLTLAKYSSPSRGEENF